MSVRLSIRPRALPLSTAIPSDYEYLKTPGPPSKYRVTIRHPGYQPDEDVLCSMHAWDHGVGGLHHGFAHTACGILADNRFDGYLSRSRNGSEGDPVTDIPFDGVLPAGDYWYYVRDSSSTSQRAFRWPVVPTFQEYRFPDTLPDIWSRCASMHVEIASSSSQSATSVAVRARDIRCKVTGWEDGTEVAHLVPDHERKWFLSNNMSRYNEENTLDPENLLRDPNNLLLLRSDIHTQFNDRKLVFFPKAPGTYVIHMLKPSKETLPLYHNTTIDLASCAIEFLFARFAWSIFPALSGFLSWPDRTRLVVCTDKNTGERKATESTSITLSPLVSASRSSSPSKRSRTAASLDDSLETCENSKPSAKRQRRISNDIPSPNLASAPSLYASDTAPSQEEALSAGDDHATLLRENALAQQRPKGYAHPPPYDRHRPARQELELMGVEILDELDDDENVDTCDG